MWHQFAGSDRSYVWKRHAKRGSRLCSVSVVRTFRMSRSSDWWLCTDWRVANVSISRHLSIFPNIDFTLSSRDCANIWPRGPQIEVTRDCPTIQPVLNDLSCTANSSSLVSYACLTKLYLSIAGNECCGLHLMDSAPQRVAIETSWLLTPDTYKAVRLRVCTTDPVSVQLWQRVDEVTYQFRWQIQFAPSAIQTALSYVIVRSFWL